MRRCKKICSEIYRHVKLFLCPLTDESIPFHQEADESTSLNHRVSRRYTQQWNNNNKNFDFRHYRKRRSSSISRLRRLDFFSTDSYYEDDEIDDSSGGPSSNHDANHESISESVRQATVHALTDDFASFEDSQVFAVTRLCMFYVVGYILVSIVAFWFLEPSWTIVDSAYFAIQLMTTVGYGDLAPSHDGSRVFVIFFALNTAIVVGVLLGMVGHFLGQIQATTVQKFESEAERNLLSSLRDDRPYVFRYHDNPINNRNNRMSRNNQTIDATFPRLSNASVATAENYFRPKTTLVGDLYKVIKTESPLLLLLLCILIVLGRFEGWSLISCCYFSIISVTTIGLGDLTPSNQELRTALLIFLPLAVAAFGDLLTRIASCYVLRQNQKMERRFLRRSITLCDFETMDTDQNGLVSREEFLCYILVRLRKVDHETLDNIKILFDQLDVTNTGSLDRRDLAIMAHQRRGWASLRKLADILDDTEDDDDDEDNLNNLHHAGYYQEDDDSDEDDDTRDVEYDLLTNLSNSAGHRRSI